MPQPFNRRHQSAARGCGARIGHRRAMDLREQLRRLVASGPHPPRGVSDQDPEREGPAVRAVVQQRPGEGIDTSPTRCSESPGGPGVSVIGEDVVPESSAGLRVIVSGDAPRSPHSRRLLRLSTQPTSRIPTPPSAADFDPFLESPSPTCEVLSEAPTAITMIKDHVPMV